MHYMVVMGVLGYGADTSANQAARPKCRVAIDRETFSSTTTKQPVFSPLLRKIRLPPACGRNGFLEPTKSLHLQPCLQSTSKLGAGRYGLPDSLSPDPLAPLANEEHDVRPKISMIRGIALCLPQGLFEL